MTDDTEDIWAVFDPPLDRTGTAVPGSYDRMLASRDAGIANFRVRDPWTGLDAERKTLEKQLAKQQAESQVRRAAAILEVKRDRKRLQAERKETQDETFAVYEELTKTLKAAGSDPAVMRRGQLARRALQLDEMLSNYDRAIMQATTTIADLEATPIR